MEWAQVRALAADGVSQREIAARLGINRRKVRRLVAADEPPRYRRSPQGSMLDPLELSSAIEKCRLIAIEKCRSVAVVRSGLGRRAAAL
jgi:transposase